MLMNRFTNRFHEKEKRNLSIWKITVPLTKSPSRITNFLPSIFVGKFSMTEIGIRANEIERQVNYTSRNKWTNWDGSWAQTMYSIRSKNSLKIPVEFSSPQTRIVPFSFLVFVFLPKHRVPLKLFDWFLLLPFGVWIENFRDLIKVFSGNLCKHKKGKKFFAGLNYFISIEISGLKETPDRKILAKLSKNKKKKWGLRRNSRWKFIAFFYAIF